MSWIEKLLPRVFTPYARAAPDDDAALLDARLGTRQWLPGGQQ